MTTSIDQFLAAIEQIEQPFPGRVERASSYGLPIFNTGLAHWNIVDASGTGDVVATIQFRMPADPSSIMAKKYLKAVEARADRLAEIINLGLIAHAMGGQVD